ncbi:MAG: CDP-alcohol phosphatidyltransferase family protein [Bacteroidota bacterium]
MKTRKPYSYSRSKKSDQSDELINVYFVRPIAGVLVRILYPTPATPNQVTVAAILVGFLSAWVYSGGTTTTTQVAGVLLLAKDALDAADGQLARAREQYSRKGRFLDSIGDFFVSLSIFVSIGISVSRHEGSYLYLLLALFAFLSVVLHISYHVLYHTSFLHLENSYTINRTTEEIRPEDLNEDPWTRRLQRIFLFLYGWQDAMMVRLDRWAKRGLRGSDEAWYGDRVGIRWSGFLGLGTENIVLVLFSLFDALPQYLLFNLVFMNLVWWTCVLYRRTLAGRLAKRAP